MKTIKFLNKMTLYPVVKLISFMLTAFSLNACSSKFLQLERHKEKEQIKESISLEGLQNESLVTQQIAFTNDSTDHAYKLIIFPLDTFTYSPTEGFKGKALKIELSGITRQMKKQYDSSGSQLTRQVQIDYNINRDNKILENRRSRTVERTRLSWWLGIGIVLMIGVLLRFYWKEWRDR